MTKARHRALIIFALAIFFAASYFSGSIVQTMPSVLGGKTGALAYVLLHAFSVVVIVPVSTMPLIPLAVQLWGVAATTFLNIAGWTLGATVAFLIARALGRPYAERLTGKEALDRFEKLMPEKYLFWNVMLLRMAVPVDILSYVVGAFTAIRLPMYVLATALGVAPFAFIFSYVTSLEIEYQLVAGAVIIGLIIGINMWVFKIKPR